MARLYNATSKKGERTMSYETVRHQLLKEQAATILKDEGFKENEIFFEYTIKNNLGDRYRIDVAGITTERKIFIECGTLSGKDRIKKLKTICDKLIYLPYVLTTIQINTKTRERLHEFRYLKETYDKLLNRLLNMVDQKEGAA